MLRRRARLIGIGLLAAAAASVVSGFKDPHGIFCGEDECYTVLGLQRGADKAEIRKAYRTISLEIHPDKNSNPAAKERFTKVAKAYAVFMDEELNKKYHHFLDHPDAYWLEYGHSWVLEYAKATDVRLVLLGLIALVSFFVYGIQYTRYTTAVKYLRKAAEKNLGPKQGGNAATMQLRRDAEALLAERKGAQAKKGGAESRGNKVKQSRKEKEAELAAVIEELALQVDIQGSCHKPTWRDQPVVILTLLPWNFAMDSWHRSRLVIARVLKKEPDRPDREYWARRNIGMITWEGLDDHSRKAAVEGDAWRGGEGLEEWKEVYLYGGSSGAERASSKGLRQRKSATAGRHNPVVANGNMMKGVLGEGPEVEY